MDSLDGRGTVGPDDGNESKGENLEEEENRKERFKSLWFIIPSVLTALAIAVVVGTYTPLVFDASAYATASDTAEELVTVEVDESATTETSIYSTSDYTVDTSNLQDGVYTGTAYGYKSYITVQVTIENGKIVSIEILSQDEDEEYFEMALAVISSIISAQSTSVDTVSGATLSSEGILVAVANALAKAQGSSTVLTTTSSSSSSSSSSAHNSSGTYGMDVSDSDLEDGVYTGTSYGYKSYITVSVTISGGEITSIEIVSQDEDEDYFEMALAVISSIISAQSTSVDTVSGATLSSEGIIYAVEDALSQAKKSTSSDEDDEDGDDTDDGDDDSDDGDDEEEEETENPYKSMNLLDGTYTAYALCGEGATEFDTYYLVATVTIEDGVPVSITDVYGTNVMDGEETLQGYDSRNDSYIQYAVNGRWRYYKSWTSVVKQLIEQYVSSSDIVAVSGATYSSESLAEVFDLCIAQAAAAYEAVYGSDDSDSDTDSSTSYADGTYTTYVVCGDDSGNDEFDPYYLVITVTIEDGEATAITDVYGTNEMDGEETLAGYDKDNDDYIEWAVNGRTTSSGTWTGVVEQIIEQGIAASSITVVSGATYSCDAIAEAFELALELAAAAYEEENGTDTDTDTDTESTASSILALAVSSAPDTTEADPEVVVGGCVTSAVAACVDAAAGDGSSDSGNEEGTSTISAETDSGEFTVVVLMDESAIKDGEGYEVEDE